MTTFAGWLAGAAFLGICGWSVLLAELTGHWLFARLVGSRGLLPTQGRGGQRLTRRRRVIVWAGGLLGAYGLCSAFSLAGLLSTGRLEVSRSVQVLHQMPAETAGLRDADEIVSIDGEPVRDFEHLRQVVKRHPESAIRVEVVRGSGRLVFEVVPDQSGTIGVRSMMRRQSWPLGEVSREAGLYPAKTWVGLSHSLALAARGRKSADLAGPAEIAQLVGGQAKRELLLALAAYTSMLAAYLVPAQVLLLIAYLLRRD